MSTFQVVNARTGKTVLETDDWVDAENMAVASHAGRSDMLHVRGTHPSHNWDDQRPRRCRNCDGWDNGSYGSHAPCGYNFSGEGGSSLVAALARELDARAAAEDLS